MVPAAALKPAASVTLWATPGVSVRVAGLAVTPAGRPLSVTLTGSVKPLNGAAVTDTFAPAALPMMSVRAVGVTDSVKPGAPVVVMVSGRVAVCA